VALGQALVQVGRQAGYDEEMDWLLEILSWPVEWSALHGIAEIKTPVLKVSTRTDATAKKYTVRRPATTYPVEGALGIRFPYRLRSARSLVTMPPGSRRGLDHPIRAAGDLPQWYASDNGFTSPAAMDRAHESVVESARAVLNEVEGNLLDLGCGNGALLRRLSQVNERLVPFGIDLDPTKVAHARELLPSFGANFSVGDFLDSEPFWTSGRRYALVVLMPGRLIETDPARARRLLERIEANCDRLVVYAYGDWLTRYGDLHGLAERAGLALVRAGVAATASLATYRATDRLAATAVSTEQAERQGRQE
jgi:SAM-dependent methyltransferase